MASEASDRSAVSVSVLDCRCGGLGGQVCDGSGSLRQWKVVGVLDESTISLCHSIDIVLKVLVLSHEGVLSVPPRESTV